MGLGEMSCTGCWSLLSPTAMDNMAVPWARGQESPVLLVPPMGEELCCPSVPLLVGSWPFCARKEFGGILLHREMM